MPLPSNGLIEFGQFRFDGTDRTLWRDGQMVPLAPKALDTLAALVEDPGKLVSKEDLIKAVWPDTFVEEGNLAVQISLLRKTFGTDSFIETVPRRGYRFVAPIREPASAATPDPPAPAVPNNAPVSRRWVVTGAAIALAGGAGVLWGFRRHRDAPARISVASIAVLPFQVLNPKAEDASLGLSLADAVIVRLGGLNRFVVRPTSAVRDFDQPNRDPLSAGKKLDVEAVLNATIHVSDGRLRLNAQLLRVGDGRSIWSDTFDLERADLFTLEDQLARRLQNSFLGETPAAPKYRPNAEAYRLYLLGQYYQNRWDPTSERRAIEYAEQAIAIDPNYAAAYTLKAVAWSRLGYLFGVPPREAYPKAEEAAQAALRLDDSISDGHSSMASIRMFYTWDFAQAERYARRALELNANSAESLHLLGIVLAVRHRNAEGVATLKKALEIDPTTAWRRVGMTFEYACNNQIDLAIEEAKKAIDLDPLLGAPYLDLYNLYMVRGDPSTAVEWYFRQQDRASANPAASDSLKQAFRETGIKGFLEARIERMSKSGAAPMAVAQQYAYLGKRDEAVQWIEKAEQERQGLVLLINQHPMYASLRSHPRFQAVVKRLGL